MVKHININRPERGTKPAAMKRVLITKENKRVIIDTKNDHLIYETPVNPPNTGLAYTRGDDLYIHRTTNGNMVYYLYHWSLWQGEGESVEIITPEEAESFLIERLGKSGWGGLSEEEAKRIEKLTGLSLLTETA